MLVLEDNAALRRIVGHQLRELGYRVLEAENAVEAVTVLAQQNVDLLFTDVIMPGETTGFEPTRTALALAGPEGSPHIGLSTSEVNGDIEATAPEMRLLTKPYRSEDLARTLRQVLDRWLEGPNRRARRVPSNVPPVAPSVSRPSAGLERDCPSRGGGG